MGSLSRIVALATTVALAGGCAAASGSQWTSNDGPLPAHHTETRVEVQNNNWSDMVVYAVRYNTRTRLGMVTSMNTRNFDLPKSVNLASGAVELVAEAIGSRERFGTGPINMNEGQSVELKIENQLAISSWSVW
ncbi:MAG: hypothetical protein WD766_00385 [Gemmatimonadota bacterium]